MVNRNLIRGLDAGSENWEQEINAAIGSEDTDLLVAPSAEVSVNQIISGHILRVDPEFVLVDVGYKSEGVIPRREWEEDEEEPQPGQTVDVLIEEIEDVGTGGETNLEGMILLSKRKAKKIQEWENVMSSVKEGDVVTGVANRKIKGGLLVDIGVNVFLPASQVDIRRPPDIGEYLGRSIQCKVLKIDDARRNIVVSRRALIEDEREEKKAKLLEELEVGQLRTGVVKNIADFGAFVDLGGLDGLLHITDMSWGRIGHPSEMVAIDQEIEVKVLDIDYKKEKIALGLKQKTPSPWEEAAAKYPPGSTVRGTVVNVMSYGAFVKLEDGIEGLVHISEMSWTRRVNHPNELVSINDEIDVVVLGINEEKHEISLGMKQTQANPWDKVAERYPPDSLVKGTVRNLTNYGAFVEIEEGIDGLLHISDMSWTRKISHPSEMLEKGQEVECKVVSVDQERRRIALGLKQMSEDPWASDIPGKYQPGQIVTGKVTKLTNFGVFVGLEHGLEGLLHISELAEEKIENPEDVVKEGDEIEVKILRVDPDERKIGLSRKRVDWAEEDEMAEAQGGTESQGEKPVAPLKGGIGDESGPLIKTDESEPDRPEPSAAEEQDES
ncbi:MAG: S1 RNA-binding domain-containing protein [Planctomycetales bacterium]|nr:S1 RNA-binding domain-containing protein [Planctomycetales bacterium]NIM07916.1 S1 RNA-binding domain-containing protein [Planctomycetales bacterium]NIN07403.1 S1 RNA-binding domain-containing protein [Planctomycetales bacterium]NIN76507.1 S1 RNA-binding domain-containing protein [Planctomycetales bacterium]NIO33697.1 S1 RNA-binding domain-containing protein [Planctomycetales bacterium]